MKKSFIISCFVFAAATLVCVTFVSNASGEAISRPVELEGYWELQSVTVDDEEDTGEQGSYLILRAGGSFRIVKRGRKPEGIWGVGKDNKLLLIVGNQTVMRTAWFLEGDDLTLSYEKEGSKVEIRYLKVNLENEPTDPHEY